MIKRSAASITLIACICVLAGWPTFAQVGSMRAKLKVGLTIDVTVAEVTDWGFWLEDETGLLYKQLSSLSTTSDFLTTEVMRYVPEATLETTKAAVVIDFEGLTFPERIPKTHKALRSRSIHGGLQGGITAELETNLEASIPGLKNFFGRVGHSVGWSVVDKGGFLGGLQAGIGRLFPIGDNQLAVTAEVWQKYRNHEGFIESKDETDISFAPDAYSVTAFYRLPVVDGRYTLSLGARGYLKNVEYGENRSRAAVVILLGTSI